MIKYSKQRNTINKSKQSKQSKQSRKNKQNNKSNTSKQYNQYNNNKMLIKKSNNIKSINEIKRKQRKSKSKSKSNSNINHHKGGFASCNLATIKEPSFNIPAMGGIDGLSIPESRGAIFRPNCKTDTYQAMTP